MSNVVSFGGITTVTIPAADELEKAKSWGMEDVLICGFGPKGEFHFGANNSDCERLLMLIKLAEKQIVDWVAHDQR